MAQTPRTTQETIGTWLAIGKAWAEGAVDCAWNVVENLSDKAFGKSLTPRVSPAPLSGKVCIITGGNAGIGFATAELLAQRGAHVILACRSKERGEAAVAKLYSTCKLLPGCGDKPKVEFMQVDVASLSSVRRFCDTFNSKRMPLHLLVANAGLMSPAKRLETEDGLEMQFQVNFLGHWLMAQTLLAEQRERRAKKYKDGKNLPTTPLMLSQGGGKEEFRGWGLHEDGTRVVFLSSVTHHAGYDNWKDMQSKRHYDPFTSYALSKLACNISAWELHHRLVLQAAAPDGAKWGRDSAVAVHPGVVDTDLGTGFFKQQTLTRLLPSAAKAMDTLVDALAPLAMKTPTNSAAVVGVAALAPADQVGGKYIVNGKVARASRASTDPKLAEELWSVSQGLTGLTIHPSLI